MKGNVSKAKGSGVSVADGKVIVKDGSVNIELVQAYQTYGVSVDLSNSNPETAVTYIDDAVGMAAGSPDWYKAGIFKHIKPCLFKNGAVAGYLDPDNFAQLADGTAADITSGYSGDVMIEIPKLGYRITTSGSTLTVQVTDDPNKDGFSYKAHTRKEEGDRDKLYIGAFLGSSRRSALRSLSGVSPTAIMSLSDLRRAAQRNGAGYDLLSFYPLTLLQCLYLIMYKNLNSQAALGMGYVGGSKQEQHCMKTGATADKGMSYGTEDPMEQMKFLGMEDFWGNQLQRIEGLVSTTDGHILTATDGFNDTGEGYTDLGQLTLYDTSDAYMTRPQGSIDLGFLLKRGRGSSSTYFSDCADVYFGHVPFFGGTYFDGAKAGAFRLVVGWTPDSLYEYFGGRLMFL